MFNMRKVCKRLDAGWMLLEERGARRRGRFLLDSFLMSVRSVSVVFRMWIIWMNVLGRVLF